MVKRERKIEYAFTLTGLIIALVIISVMAGGFGVLLTGVMEATNTTINNSFSNYSLADELHSYSEDVNSSVFDNPRDESTGIIDIIGNYFSMGWRTVTTVISSVSLTGRLIDTACADFGFVCVVTRLFKILIIIIVALLLLQALLKWYI